MAKKRYLAANESKREIHVLPSRDSKGLVVKTTASTQNKRAWESAVNDTMHTYKEAWEKLSKH